MNTTIETREVSPEQLAAWSRLWQRLLRPVATEDEQPTSDPDDDHEDS